MTRRLARIAIVSLGISAACGLIAVWTPTKAQIDGNRSLATAARSCGRLLWAESDRPAGDRDASSPAQTRTVDLEWRGSDAVQVNLPARVYYQPGPKAEASISGDPDIVSHVRMRQGAIEFDGPVNCFAADDLVVRLTGPAVDAWTVNGPGDLDLSNIKQDALRITIHGSGAITASGEAQETSLDIAGPGNADLGKLVTQRARARIRGAAEVDLAPREDADIAVYGRATVTLHGAVARLRSETSGSGQIKQVP